MSDLKYIAVIDDHTMFRRGICNLINMFPGYKVLLDANNGKDFITKLNSNNPPDIVLIDIAMPEMDGYDTAAWVKENLPDAAIIALSTMDNDNAIIRMIKSGARGYLMKDAEPEELKQAFHQIQVQGYFYNDYISRKVVSSVHNLFDRKTFNNTFIQLTDREVDFLKRICSEKPYKQIAQEMFLSERTIDGYREALFRKLDVSTRVGLVLYAIKYKLVEV